MATDFYVYGYRDHKGIMRYIGKGRGNRCNDHVSLAKSINEGRRLDRRSPFTNWLAKQIRANKPYTIERLSEGLDEQSAFVLEIATIKALGRLKREIGGVLLNRLEGGDGVTSEDARRFQSEPGFKEKHSAALLKVTSTEEFRKRLSEATKESNGRPHRRQQSREKALSEWQSETRKSAAIEKAKQLWADPVWSAARRKELVERNKKRKPNAAN